MRDEMSPTELPPGRVVGDPDRRLWISDEAVADPAELWARCHERRDVSGLRPLLYSWPLVRGGAWSLDGVDAIDLDAELEDAWRAERVFHEQVRQEAMKRPPDPEDLELEEVDLEEVELMPSFTDWPGLAPAVPADSTSPDPDDVAAAVVRRLMTELWWLNDCHLVLVPAERNADIPAVIKWSPEADLDRLYALLRSWEDRFGARVVIFQGDRMWVSVARPPVTVDHATHVALEHFLTGTDTMREFTPFADYAAGLVGNQVWEFWWD